MTNCMVRRNNLDVIHNINLRFREMQPPVIASPSTVLHMPDSSYNTGGDAPFVTTRFGNVLGSGCLRV